MSRCFPYPPPGYSLNTSNDEALIESIKLQKEREKAKAERKKEKKEKKRDKEKRDKTAKKDPSGSGFDEAAHQSKGKYIFKCSGEETELLERSNLTEEHGHAMCSQNSSCSSDSTQNSNKRKRPLSPARNGIQAHGSIIRIRLSKKKKDPQGGSSNSNVNCLSVHPQQGSASNSNVMCFSVPPQQGSDSNSDVKCFSVPPQQKTKVTVRASTYKSSVPPCVSVPESKPSTSGRVDKAAAASCSKVHESSIEFQYKNLIENWIPPRLQSEHHDFDDQEWLFQRKPKQTRVEEKVGVASSGSSCGSLAALWPRAQYLHDAEIYALPYTVPY